MRLLSLILFLSTGSMAFSPETTIRTPHVIPKRHATIVSMASSNHTHTVENNNMDIGHIIGNCYRKGKQNHNKQCGCMIVRFISSFLPHADGIGHKVLHANNEFVNYIMNLDEKKVSHKTKGRIIMLSISIAQWGDNVGSKILQMYYDIVNKCFEIEEKD